jgi:hypothetical protein
MIQRLMTKYKEYFQKMLAQNQKEFEAFKKIHDLYALDPQKWQEKFNEEGKKIQYIIRKYEDMLCSRSEGSGYGVYSGKLAEKFQAEIKKEFPKIDSIGIIVFKLKKISLS